MACVVVAGACSQHADPEPRSTGPCDVAGPETIEFATGKGAAYRVLEEGDELQLVFGSQAGMEARVIVQTSGIVLDDVDHAEVELLVEGYPIAQMDISGRDCTCQDATGRMDAPMLVDVVPHPTVQSVVQLDQREAELVVHVFDVDGQVRDASTRIVLLT